MEDYQRAKGTKLKLKTPKNAVAVVSIKKKKRKLEGSSSGRDAEEKKAAAEISLDTSKHGKISNLSVKMMIIKLTYYN